MQAKTLLASLVTIWFLVGFVFATFAGVAIASQAVELPVALALGVGVTMLWSLLVWLISPWIMDLVQRWVYKAQNITIEELSRERPAVASFVSEVCRRHNIKVPRLKLIEDQTPQAYCYGSYANNARLVVTRGILHYLDDEEVKAVYGHELGHIVHRDFIVMTIAATMLQILWNTYVICKNVRGKSSRPLYLVALAALAFYWVGQFMLLYLSRTREYYADEFAGQETGNPNALSLALIKIAYGLTAETPSPLAQKLMGGTRALGISDPKSAGGTGFAYRAMSRAAVAQDPTVPAYGDGAAAAGVVAEMPVTMDGVRRIEKVMLFDLYNPWATVCELGSTHPLTGKRIKALGQQAVMRGKPALLSFERIDASGQALDMGRMYSTFFFEVAIYFMPHILGALFLMAAIGLAATGNSELAAGSAGMVLFGVGLGMTIKGFYAFGSLGEPAMTNVIELMSDPYASLLKGRPVRVQGTVIGRLDAGNRISEDVMIEDPRGGLMAINYESPFGFLGNWWFAWRRVGKLMQQQVHVVGWFRRSVSQQIDLKRMETGSGDKISSWTGFWGKVGGVVVLLIGLVVGGVAWMTAAESGRAIANAAAAATATAAATDEPAPEPEPAAAPAPPAVRRVAPPGQGAAARLADPAPLSAPRRPGPAATAHAAPATTARAGATGAAKPGTAATAKPATTSTAKPATTSTAKPAPHK